MKLNYEFVKREVAGEQFLVPIGRAALVFDGIITLNELGGFIFDCIPSCSDENEIADKIAESYDVDKETASADTHDFFVSLAQAGITAAAD